MAFTIPLGILIFAALALLRDFSDAPVILYFMIFGGIFGTGILVAHELVTYLFRVFYPEE